MAVLLALSSWANAALTTVDGTDVAGEVISATPKQVILATGGRSVTMKMPLLSPESQAEVIASAKAAKKWNPFPPLTIDVEVAAKRRNKEGSFYIKLMRIEPKMVMSGGSTLEPIPAAEATLLVVTMDTRAKYTEKRESYFVESNEKLPIPAALDGKRRVFDFKTSEVSYDGYRDATNIGGRAYKYFVFALRDPESGSITNFQTNQPELQRLVATNPAKMEEVLALKTSGPFPATFK